MARGLITNVSTKSYIGSNGYGYNFFFKVGEDVLAFPITPSKLNMKVGSNNQTVTLISGGDINILKSPSLIEVEFDARFPMRQYPYARTFTKFEDYWDVFQELKEKKESFRFIVTRTTPDNTRTWDTNILVALEDVLLSEDADEGDDVIVSFKLKQFKEYGVKTVKVKDDKPTTNSTKNEKRPTENKTSKTQTYTVKSGDCLWNIAKKFYGDGSKWKKIYNANKTAIENDAKKHGKKSSSNGDLIFPGLKLTIPAL